MKRKLAWPQSAGREYLTTPSGASLNLGVPVRVNGFMREAACQAMENSRGAARAARVKRRASLADCHRARTHFPRQSPRNPRPHHMLSHYHAVPWWAAAPWMPTLNVLYKVAARKWFGAAIHVRIASAWDRR